MKNLFENENKANRFCLIKGYRKRYISNCNRFGLSQPKPIKNELYIQKGFL